VNFVADNPRGHFGRDEILMPAKLWWDGSEVLDNHYPAMTPIDPVRLILNAKTET
jgi:hypothetical protein